MGKISSDIAFRLMAWEFRRDERKRHTGQIRLQGFRIDPGMTVVDYGCGPARYTKYLSEAVGKTGIVCSVDIVPLALEYVKDEIKNHSLTNVRTFIARGSDSGIPDKSADMVLALDMFHRIVDVHAFLAELHRIAKPSCALILDYGHQPQESAIRKVKSDGLWIIEETTEEYIRCHPASSP